MFNHFSFDGGLVFWKGIGNNVENMFVHTEIIIKKMVLMFVYIYIFLSFIFFYQDNILFNILDH
jgi:hypothetical protein